MTEDVDHPLMSFNRPIVIVNNFQKYSFEHQKEFEGLSKKTLGTLNILKKHSDINYDKNKFIDFKKPEKPKDFLSNFLLADKNQKNYDKKGVFFSKLDKSDNSFECYVTGIIVLFY